jgi:hypothetical protein
MTKTPFEIRADLLKLAADHLEKQFVANLKFATEYNRALGDVATEALVKMPNYFTTDEVIKKAAEFYNFVQTK